MQTASTPLTNTLQQSNAIFTKPRLIAEWNHNRYATISTIDNFGYPEATNGFDLELFPIESVVAPIRPTAGITVARGGEGVTTTPYSDDPTSRRSYTASIDAKYKYWTSPLASSGVISGGSYPMTNCQPHVIYSNTRWTNKIYVCFENSWTQPVTWDIQVTTDGTNFSTVASNLTPNATTGVIEIYRQANGTWSTTVYRDNPQQIRGIKLVISSMNKASSYMSLIEMGARLESDLSDVLVSYNVSNEMDGADTVFPFGRISANTGNVTLSNFDGRFTPDNSSSIYYGLIDANVEFRMDVGIDTTAYAGSGYEYTRQFTMYVDGNWETSIDTASVTLKDSSKFLQEIFPNSLFFENVTVGQAIWKLLDSVGFNSYSYSKAVDDDPTYIPFYWTDKSKSVWENIGDLCRGTQNAAFFDEFDTLKILTRNAAYDKTKAAVWNLDGAVNGSKQPDIVELKENGQFEANKVKINYRPTALAYNPANGKPISEIIWQPEDTVSLRSSSLVTAMTASQMTFSIPVSDAKVWPFSGFVNIQGEIIKYDAKQYFYFDKTNTPTFKWVTSLDQQRAIDRSRTSSTKANLSKFTGAFRITERGYDTSYADTHEIGTTGWTTGFYGLVGGTQTAWSGGVSTVPAQSLLRVQTNKTFTDKHWYCVRAPQKLSTAMRQYGFRMRFPKSPHGTEFSAGYFFWANSASNSMYAVDINTTANLTKNKRREVSNEISLIKRTGGVVTRLGGKGFAMNLVPGQWVDIDIRVLANSNISILVNGRQVLSITDGSPLTETSNNGPYVRGFTVAEFEYVYVTSLSPKTPNSDADDSDFLDLIRGGYVSNQPWENIGNPKFLADRRRRGRRSANAKVPYQYIYEFGADVHEVRKYEVDFDKYPVIYSSLYMTNTSQAVCDEYHSTPFGAKFFIANASRQNCVVNGEDTLTFGINSPVQQKLVITGRTVQQKEPVSINVQDDAALKARGEIPLEISSDWLQSESSAKQLGDWIVNNWKTPADTVEVEIFGNPLLQLSDMVSVNYAAKNMLTATHKYFIRSIDHSWENGLKTTLVLRRSI